jgi:PhzF family phenazine biosynthesis protein
MESRYFLIDVFGATPMSGNPLPVVIGASHLSTERMQAITQWFNYSETTFLLPPTTEQADYRVRIFTLERELSFAGHPTLGSCCAWLASGGRSRDSNTVVQECGAGPVPIRRTEGRLAFAAPRLIRSGPVEESKLTEVANFLGINRGDVVDATWADNGPGWVALLLESAEKVLALRPKHFYPTHLDVGVVGAHPGGAATDFELRAFFTDHQGVVREDPVTGSLNASVAQWLFASGRARDRYLASQGTSLGRVGRVHLTQDSSSQVWVGGNASVIASGQLAELS